MSESRRAHALAALQVLPAVSIFITGFVAVRGYGQRDRSFKRAEELEAEVRRFRDRTRTSWIRRADLHRAMGDPVRARADYEEAIGLDRVSVAPLLALARLDIDTGSPGDAIGLVKQAVELEPGNADLEQLMREAEEARRERETERAREQVRQRLEGDQRDKNDP